MKTEIIRPGLTNLTDINDAKVSFVARPTRWVKIYKKENQAQLALNTNEGIFTMKNFRIALFILSMLVASSTSAIPVDSSFIGNLADDDDVALIDFTVGAPSDITLRTWSYAGGTNAAGVVIPAGGFDPILALFDGAGIFLAENDDGFPDVSPDPVTGAQYDSILDITLAAGDYTVAVTQFSNFFNGLRLADGFSGSGESGFNARTSSWALDILNVVPEPAVLSLLILGLFGIGLTRRNKLFMTDTFLT